MFVRKNAMVSTSAVALAANTEEGNTVPNIDGDALAADAKAMGAKAGDASDSAFTLVVKAKEDWQGGPFKVLFGLQADFTQEQLDTFPIPGNEEGNNPDVFYINKEGAKKPVKSSFYAQFCDGTPAGQRLLERLEWVKRAGEANMVKTDIPSDIMDMSPEQRDTHQYFLEGRRVTIRGAIKKALELYQQFEAVKGYNTLIVCEPLWVAGKSPDDVDYSKGELPEVENTTKPIRIAQVDAKGFPVKYDFLSIGAFLKLNVNKATEKGGTFRSLLDSGATKKAAGSGSTTNDGDGIVIKTTDRGVAIMAELHRWADEIHGAKDQVEYGKLLKMFNTKDNDELIVAAVELRNFLSDILAATHGDAKYTKLQSSGSELTATTAKAAA